MNTSKLDARLTSRAFRCAVLRAFPAAEGHPARLRLLLVLLLCPWLDEDGRTVLTYSQLAACSDSTAQAAHGNYDAKPLLGDFEAHVLPLDLTAPTWASTERYSTARTAAPVWPAALLDALHAELSLSRSERLRDAVYFITGRAYRPRQHRENLNVYRRQALEDLLAYDHPALDLMRYANTQHVTVFNRMVERHIDGARAVALAIRKCDASGQLDATRTQAAQHHALRILHALESDAQPFYAPSTSGNTARIFAEGLSYLGLPKAVRRALMPDCPELDLSNAQLAVAARDWDIPEVQAFLSSGRRIWPELAAHFGVDLDTYKPILKTTLYSLLFGMPKPALVRQLALGGVGETGQGIGSEAAARLFDHPLTAALYEARERQLKALQTAGYARTVFGQTLPVVDARTARSALAAQAQARELWLLLPAVEVLKRTPDLTLLAWQHDGFTVHSSNASKQDRYVRQLQQAVKTRAEQGGYMTGLECAA